MFDHVSIGVRDVAKAKAFYDAALKPLGLTCLSADETSLGYGKDSPRFWILKAEHPVPDDPKSGLHFCFAAPSQESVKAFHAAAMAHGGRDNGKPGLRKDYGPHYYAAFVYRPRRLPARSLSWREMTDGDHPIRNQDASEASEVWSAVRDIGALHTRLVPGFVTDTKLEPGARVVTFVNGVLREPIVALDDRRGVSSGRTRAAAPGTTTPRSRFPSFPTA